MKATFVKLVWENDTRTIASFYFQPAQRYRYEAGQYAVLSVPHLPMDNRGDERTMTLSSSPNDALLKFTMRVYGEAGSSFKRALLALRPGDKVTVYDSMGDLVLPLDSSIPLVFVAGGVGIASFTGMTQWLAESRDARNITLHYAVARPADVIMQQPFDAYSGVTEYQKGLYLPAGSGAVQFQGKILQKRLDADDIVATMTPDSLVYISGTERMVEQLRRELMATYGLPQSQIIFDFFDGYSEL